MILVIDISAPDYGVNMSVINLTNDIINQFKKHGESDYPHECCGFILGNFINKESIGVEYLPAANTKEENRERRWIPKNTQRSGTGCGRRREGSGEIPRAREEAPQVRR